VVGNPFSRGDNPGRKAFYQLYWRLGGSPGRMTNLKGEDADRANGTVSIQDGNARTNMDTKRVKHAIRGLT